jgi:hypothetical protein
LCFFFLPFPQADPSSPLSSIALCTYAWSRKKRGAFFTYVSSPRCYVENGSSIKLTRLHSSLCSEQTPHLDPCPLLSNPFPFYFACCLSPYVIYALSHTDTLLNASPSLLVFLEAFHHPRSYTLYPTHTFPLQQLKVASSQGLASEEKAKTPVRTHDAPLRRASSDLLLNHQHQATRPPSPLLFTQPHLPFQQCLTCLDAPKMSATLTPAQRRAPCPLLSVRRHWSPSRLFCSSVASSRAFQADHVPLGWIQRLLGVLSSSRTFPFLCLSELERCRLPPQLTLSTALPLSPLLPLFGCTCSLANVSGDLSSMTAPPFILSPTVRLPFLFPRLLLHHPPHPTSSSP